MNRWHLYLAARILRRGGIIAYPTEAVYGLGCLPEDREAVFRILRLKNRTAGKGLILVAASTEQLEKYVHYPDVTTRERVLATWPGPLTWLLPAKDTVPGWITGNHGTVAVRVSAHNTISTLCHDLGAIVSTSANPEHMPPAKTPAKVVSYFGNSLDYILLGNTGNLSRPTEIRNAASGAVVRPGS